MVKVLFLQSLFNMVDEQAEIMIRDRISFMNFLDYPDHLPDSTTIWIFRERLSKTGMDRIIWNELQRQMESKGINVKKGSSQDATFITSDPGHRKHDEPRNEGDLSPLIFFLLQMRHFLSTSSFSLPCFSIASTSFFSSSPGIHS